MSTTLPPPSAERRRPRLQALDDDDDPMLSMVNLIDVFLVLIAALLIALAQHPLNPFTQDAMTIIKNPGQANMEIIRKDGQQLERLSATGGTRQGGGVKAGVAYRLEDGSMVYVPE